MDYLQGLSTGLDRPWNHQSFEPVQWFERQQLRPVSALLVSSVFEGSVVLAVFLVAVVTKQPEPVG